MFAPFTTYHKRLLCDILLYFWLLYSSPSYCIFFYLPILLIWLLLSGFCVFFFFLSNIFFFILLFLLLISFFLFSACLLLYSFCFSSFHFPSPYFLSLAFSQSSPALPSFLPFPLFFISLLPIPSFSSFIFHLYLSLFLFLFPNSPFSLSHSSNFSRIHCPPPLSFIMSPSPPTFPLPTLFLRNSLSSFFLHETPK